MSYLRKVARKLPSVAILAAFLGFWEWLAHVGFISQQLWSFLTPPSVIVARSFTLFVEGGMLYHICGTLYRGLIGLLIGVSLGVVFGLLCGWFRVLDEIIMPIFEFLRPLPALALFPLLLLLFGFGDLTKIVAVALQCFFATLIPTFYGVRDVDKLLVDSARIMGARGRNLFFDVLLRAATPHICNGIRISIGVAMIVVTAAEMLIYIVGQYGLGSLISWTEVSRDYPTMLSSIVVVMLLGFFLVWIWLKVENKLLFWVRETAAERV